MRRGESVRVALCSDWVRGKRRAAGERKPKGNAGHHLGTATFGPYAARDHHFSQADRKCFRRVQTREQWGKGARQGRRLRVAGRVIVKKVSSKAERTSGLLAFFPLHWQVRGASCRGSHVSSC